MTSKKKDSIFHATCLTTSTATARLIKMKNVDLTVKDLRVFLTRRECNKTLKTNKFPSTCKVFSPTHLRRLLLSGPTDGFTNLLIRLQVRRRSIKLYLESGYQDFVWQT